MSSSEPKTFRELASVLATEGGERFRRAHDEWKAAREDPAKMKAWNEKLRESARADQRERQAEEEARFPEHLLDCGVGKLTVDALCSKPQGTMPLIAACQWAQEPEPRRFLVLCGPPGSGKTVGAAEALRWFRHRWTVDGIEWWAYNASALFVAANAIAAAVFDQDGKALLWKARTKKLLIIDDVGREYADQGGRWQSEFESIIDFRHEAKLRTIITTNLDLATFKERVGARITNRMAQSVRAVACGVVDLRRPEAP